MGAALAALFQPGTRLRAGWRRQKIKVEGGQRRGSSTVFGGAPNGLVTGGRAAAGKRGAGECRMIGLSHEDSLLVHLG